MAALAPPEILDQIFSKLSAVDLRNVRLVCQSFAPSAARHLFREMFIWPNKECLQNLNRITSHSTFRQYVKSVLYSDRVFPWLGGFDHWSSRLDEIDFRRTLKNAKEHYQAYVLRNQYEKDLRANGTLKRKLTRALALMPNLENVYVNPILQTYSVDKASILRVFQETLCEPLRFAEDDSTTSRQRCELLDSLCDFNSQIKVLEGRILPRETLDHPSVPLYSLGRRIRHLTLDLFDYERYSTVCLVGLMQILETALEVETLKLYFHVKWERRPVVLFDQIWPNVVHYGSLRCLSLRGFRMSQLRLLEFLSLHASTLRSLLLYDIEFEWKEARDNICAGSWTETIHFLEEHLDLTRAEFVGVLTNRWNEAWYLEDEKSYISDC